MITEANERGQLKTCTCICHSWCRSDLGGVVIDGKRYPGPNHADGCPAQVRERFVRVEYDGNTCVIEPVVFPETNRNYIAELESALAVAEARAMASEALLARVKPWLDSAFSRPPQTPEAVALLADVASLLARGAQ